MRVDDVERLIGTTAKQMRREANNGVWDGRGPTPYFARCRRLLPLLGASLLFTRDVGHHSSGWWKNPDYERCWHLSLSFFDPETGEQTGTRNEQLTEVFLDAFYGRQKRLLWCEPPYSDDGRRMCVWHYRLFCDAAWQPIKPRGEVYGRELTEAGWKSYSDVQAEMEKCLAWATEKRNP